MNATNSVLLQRDQRHLLHSLHDKTTHLAGNLWLRGEGCELIDADGKRYIDAMSGLWNVTLGYGQQSLINAASKQMAELPYASSYAGSSNLRALELAEKLASITYPTINRFFFTSGGGESTDSTVKVARSYWKAQGKSSKYKTLCLQGGYHGTTLGAMSATGMPAYWSAFEPRMPGFVHIPNHHQFADAATAANALEQAILAEGAESVALFLLEPVCGAGAYVPPVGYWPLVREICDRYQVLLAVDEVITGFGRTGRMFALEHWDVQPDLMQFAKGITSGYQPLGGVGLSDEIADVLQHSDTPWMHCFTYSGHPVACAVALACIELIEGEDLIKAAAIQGKRLMSDLQAALSNHPQVGNIRGLGLMVAIELVEDRASQTPFEPTRGIGAAVLAEARRRGLVTRGRGDQIYLGPALVMSDAMLERLVQRMAESIEAVLKRH